LYESCIEVFRYFKKLIEDVVMKFTNYLQTLQLEI